MAQTAANEAHRTPGRDAFARVVLHKRQKTLVHQVQIIRAQDIHDVRAVAGQPGLHLLMLVAPAAIALHLLMEGDEFLVVVL